jgi:hypothetical protein
MESKYELGRCEEAHQFQRIRKTHSITTFVGAIVNYPDGGC